MNDYDYMKLALNMAEATTGQTSPNPMVGAVLVKDHQIVGIGTHIQAGGPHAEVHAIQMAGEKANGATLYVTLEPCSHYGKTPPCADLIIQSGVKKVFVATVDPNPKVCGNGIHKMKEAGIEVRVGLLQEEASQLNKVFFHYARSGLPYVTVKTAISLDGKIATVTGESKWITGEEAREDVHRYRHMHDAILVGVNTIIMDNPMLTTRLKNGGKNPIRIILDTTLKTPLEANVIKDKSAKTYIITGNKVDPLKEETLMGLGVEIIKMEQSTILISEMLKVMGKRGITSIFVEGGAKVQGSFLKENAFQEVITYIAPKLIGGDRAPITFGGIGIEQIKDVPLLRFSQMDKIGNDLRIIAVPMEVT